MSTSDLYFVIKLSQNSGQIIGPRTLDELKSELTGGNIAWTDLCRNFTEKSDWKRLFQMSELQSAMSAVPPTEKLAECTRLCNTALNAPAKKEAPPVAATTPVTTDDLSEIPQLTAPLYVYVQGSEFGPMSIEEFKTLVKGQKYKSQIYVWYKGLKAWFPLEELPLGPHLSAELVVKLRKGRRIQSMYSLVQGHEARKAKRINLVAGVYDKAKGTPEMIGICADISKSGIQIWLNSPLSVALGTELQIEIVPISITKIGRVTLTVALRWYDEASLRGGFQFVGNFQSSPTYLKLADYLDQLT